MSKTSSERSKILRWAGIGFRTAAELDCSAAHELMSPFVDSMVSPAESEALQLHLSACEPCRRQLQAFISLKNLLARMEPVRPPVDFELDTRVRLSQARNSNILEALETRLGNLLKPVAIPAIMGVSLTMLFFGLLLGTLVSNTTVLAQEQLEAPIFKLYKPVRTTSPTMVRFASEAQNLNEPLTIETRISDRGLVIDFEIISGPQDPQVARRISELLYFAQFTPATAFGKPVESRIILSFVDVRS
jgi:hypothetical protein